MGESTAGAPRALGAGLSELHEEGHTTYPALRVERARRHTFGRRAQSARRWPRCRIAIGLAICGAWHLHLRHRRRLRPDRRIAAAIGAAIGGAVGGLVGAFIGWLIDEISDFDKLGETIEANTRCTLFVTGRWVTDISHEHNEIHDIEAVSTACPMIDVPKQPQTANVAAVVAIGRQPAGGGDGINERYRGLITTQKNWPTETASDAGLTWCRTSRDGPAQGSQRQSKERSRAGRSSGQC